MAVVFFQNSANFQRKPGLGGSVQVKSPETKMLTEMDVGHLNLIGGRVGYMQPALNYQQIECE